MLVVYHSFTGKVKLFIEKLPDYIRTESIYEYKGNEPFILLTHTFYKGQIPKDTQNFLKDHSLNLMAVSSSGNKIWGDNFGRAADLISEHWNVPIINRFEYDGNDEDVEIFVQGVNKYDRQLD